MSGTKLKDWCGVWGRNGLRGALVLGSLSLSPIVHADSPLPPPARHEICSGDKSSCIELLPGQDGIVRKRNSAGTWLELWRVPGWHRWGFLSNDGRHFVACVTQDLVPLDLANPPPVALLYSPTGLLRTVQFREVVESDKKLQRTVSHWHWGRCTGLGKAEDSVLFETVTGKYSVSFSTLKVVKIP